MNDPSHDTYLLLRALADELARCEVAGVCTSPGSRSVPLVLSLTATRGLRCFSHVDERAAGFFAVGLARASGRPAVLTCTSGTAAANYLPAIVEAREARLPLIVLTADRPAELRDNGAGQTIDQIKLYGDAVRWFQEVDTTCASPERLRWIRQLACRSVAESALGPVHLNFPLREPLLPGAELGDEPGGGGRPDGRPYTITGPMHRDDPGLTAWLGRHDRGVIVAGEARGLDAAALGEALGWPVLADPMSGARRGPAAIAHYDLGLRAAAPEPDAVLRVGALPTSKPLREWLARLHCPQAMAVSDDGWPDPAGRCEARFVVSELPVDGVMPAATGWLDAWRLEDARIAALIDDLLGDELSEPAIARTAATGSEVLVVAASMPVRDVETFSPLGPTRVIANRGANGIDGTISTAYGVAATGVRTTLLIGDVAFAHDLGGLLTGTRLGLDLRIVLADNGGGGIFDFLPVATIGGPYEEHIATAPGISVAAAAAAYSAGYTAIATRDELRTALSEQCVGTRILHCRTNRTANVALHRRIAAAVTG